MDGIINFNKPRGMRSREAVNTGQQKLDGVKAGHGGTLDSLAEGVLPILVGQATRIFEYLLEQKKTYRVKARLDLFSKTLDQDGEVEKVAVENYPSLKKIENISKKYKGKIQQKPPVFSAVKQKGKRAHERARAGEEVKLRSREVYCDEIELLSYNFPTLQLKVTCGRGFYIRSLVRDICEELNIEGGVVVRLLREKYGSFTLKEAIKPGEISSNNLLPIKCALTHLPERKFSAEEIRLLTHGTFVERQSKNQNNMVALDQSGNLRAILKATEKRDKPEWKPEVVFKQSNN